MRAAAARVALCAGMAALLAAPSPPGAAVQETTCPAESSVLPPRATGDLSLAGVEADSAPDPAGRDVVAVRWEPTSQAECVVVASQQSFGQRGPTTLAAAPASAGSVDFTPEGLPGSHCVLVIPMTGSERLGLGELICVEVSNPIPPELSLFVQEPRERIRGWDWTTTVIAGALAAVATFVPALVGLRLLARRRRTA